MSKGKRCWCLLFFTLINGYVVDKEDRATTNYGYGYIVPLGARYSAPQSWVLSALFFRLTRSKR